VGLVLAGGWEEVVWVGELELEQQAWVLEVE
jgi:hypothetical protein